MFETSSAQVPKRDHPTIRALLDRGFRRIETMPDLRIMAAADCGETAALIAIRSNLAEGVGFEPTVGCPTAVFKTAAFVHSATPPRRAMVSRRRSHAASACSVDDPNVALSGA
jgi:hypothetical protein